MNAPHKKYNRNIPSRGLVLPENEVHIWRASLNVSPIRVAALKRLLSEDEICRAERYYFRRDRRSFVVRRGLLRLILGRYLGMKPGELLFDCNRYGRVELADGHNMSGLRFNLSHSGEAVIYAITRDREVGIDIEDPHRVIDMELMVRRNCSQREKADLQVVSPELRRQAFFNCWTRKEAYIKARGKGLAIALNRFTVSLIPGEPSILLNTEEGAEETARWTFKDISPGGGYIAAVIAEGNDWCIRDWEWSW